MKYIKKLILEKEFKNVNSLVFGKNYIAYKDFKKSVEIFKNKITTNLEFEFIANNIDKCRVYFKEPLQKEYNELLEEYKKLEYNEDNNFWDKNYFNFTLDSDLNRIHFGGIPIFLKGANLGYLLYKAVALKFGYISSAENSSQQVRYIWESLIKDKDFYSFYINEYGGKNRYKIGIVTKKNFDKIKDKFLDNLIKIFNNGKEVILDNEFKKKINFVNNFTIKDDFIKLYGKELFVLKNNKIKPLYKINKNSDLTKVIIRDLETFLSNVEN